MESMISEKERLILQHLVMGHKDATLLKVLLVDLLGGLHFIPPSTVKLLENVLSSFSQAISIINVSAFQPPPPPPAPHVLGSASYSTSGDDSVNWNRSQQGQSDERDSSRTRTIGSRLWTILYRNITLKCTIFSFTTEDRSAWTKYGEMQILNSKFIRSYFRCTYGYGHYQICLATKQVQRCEGNLDMYQITFYGTHTCNANLPTRKGKGEPTWAAFSNTTEDGSLWRKYRHKILNSIFLRNDKRLHEGSDHEMQNRENDSLYSQFRGKQKIIDYESSWSLLTSSSDRNTDTTLSNSHDYSGPS